MNGISELEKEELIFLDKIVESVRKIINDEKMINKCDICQGLIGRFLEKCGIEYYACSTNKVISNNVVGHSFIVALIGDNYYVIDPAFIQFKYDNSEEVVINGMKCISKSPYFYLNIIDEDLTTNLINDGYFKLTKESAFSYGNSFYLTKTAIPTSLRLIPFSGDKLIESFKKGNDILRDYNIGEIELDIKNSRNK